MSIVGSSHRGRARRLATIIALAMALAALVAASGARADELAYRDCITGDPHLGPLGSQACKEVANAGLFGAGAGVISPDGTSLYAVGYTGVARFERDPATGALAYRDCIAGSGPGNRGCLPGPPDGFDSPDDVAMSPDGKSLYITGSWGDTVTRFDRDPGTGALIYRGCITGSELNDSCTEIPSATSFGDGSGIGTISGVAVSPDGKSLYVSSGVGNGCCDDDAAVARFDRDPNGALTYVGCISGNTDLGPSGTGACELIPSASHDAVDSGLSPETMALSPDGTSIYTGSRKACEYDDLHTEFCAGSSGLARFDRDPATGALTYKGCLTGDKDTGPSGSGACNRIPSGKAGLPDTALLVTPDGASLYGGSASTIARFERDPTTGTLTYRGCTTGYKNLGPSGSGDCSAIPTATDMGIRFASGLYANSLVSSDDGSTIYAGGAANVARLDRDSTTGDLAFRDCVTGDLRAGPSGSGACTQIRSAGKYGDGAGLYASSLALSPDGDSLYATGAGAVARLGFAPHTSISASHVRRHRAAFRFGARRNSTFECKVTGQRVSAKLSRWRSCGSNASGAAGTQRYGRLRPGMKVFRVRATDDAGNTDPTPAKRRWRVRGS